MSTLQYCADCDYRVEYTGKDALSRVKRSTTSACPNCDIKLRHVCPLCDASPTGPNYNTHVKGCKKTRGMTPFQFSRLRLGIDFCQEPTEEDMKIAQILAQGIPLNEFVSVVPFEPKTSAPRKKTSKSKSTRTKSHNSSKDKKDSMLPKESVHNGTFKESVLNKTFKRGRQENEDRDNDDDNDSDNDNHNEANENDQTGKKKRTKSRKSSTRPPKKKKQKIYSRNESPSQTIAKGNKNNDYDIENLVNMTDFGLDLSNDFTQDLSLAEPTIMDSSSTLFGGTTFGGSVENRLSGQGSEESFSLKSYTPPHPLSTCENQMVDCIPDEKDEFLGSKDEDSFKNMVLQNQPLLASQDEVIYVHIPKTKSQMRLLKSGVTMESPSPIVCPSPIPCPSIPPPSPFACKSSAPLQNVASDPYYDFFNDNNI